MEIRKKYWYQLSWSDVKLFLECPRCFYNLKKRKAWRPGFSPETAAIPTAIDELLKDECDVRRKLERPLRIFEKNTIDAIPFVDESKSVKQWRERLEFNDDNTNVLLYGKIDDVFVNLAGELIVVDFKSVSTKPGESIRDSKWYKFNELQLSFYAFILQKNGWKVHKIGYLIYINVCREPLDFVFSNRLYTRTKLYDCMLAYDWIEKAIEDIKTLLKQPKAPRPDPRNCRFCEFVLKSIE